MKPFLTIIDDSEMMREFLSVFFRKSYEVTAFDDAARALAEMENRILPDLILLDLNMPGLTGTDFLARIRQSNLLCDIPVIVLSSEDSSEKRIECLALGAVDYVVKPFNPKELELRMTKHLSVA